MIELLSAFRDRYITPALGLEEPDELLVRIDSLLQELLEDGAGSRPTSVSGRGDARVARLRGGVVLRLEVAPTTAPLTIRLRPQRYTRRTRLLVEAPSGVSIRIEGRRQAPAPAEPRWDILQDDDGGVPCDVCVNGADVLDNEGGTCPHCGRSAGVQ